MKRAVDAVLPLWLLVAPVAFLLLVLRGPAGPAWSSPFGFLPALAERIPAALAWHRGGSGDWLGGAFLGLCAVTVVLAASAGLAGGILLRWLGVRRPGPLAPLLAPLAGVPAFALLIQGAGLLGLVTPGSARVGLGLLAAAGLLRLRRGVPLPRPPRGLLLPAVAVLALLALPAALPERNPDGLIYHLPVPAWWRETGRITARPDWAFAHLSQHQETLTYALAAAWPDERWGKAISLLGAAWIGRLVLAAAGPGPGWIAALIAVSAPMLADLAGSTKNDVLFALGGFGALLAVERGAAAGGRTGWIALGGWLLGGAYAVKNFGVFTALGLAVALAISPVAGFRARAWLALALPAGLVALPQVARNAIALGSPCYPFALSVFPPVGWTPGRFANMREVFNARTFPVGSLAETLTSPVLALAHASPYLLALVPVALLDSGLRRRRRTFVAFLAASFAAWAVLPTGGMVRFLLPLVPAAALLAAEAGASPIAGRIRHAVVAAGFIFAMALHAVAHLAGGGFAAAPLGAWFGLESGRAFRERTAPIGTGALDWLESGAAGPGTVLVVGQGTQWPRPRGIRLLGREIEQAPWPWTFARDVRDAVRLEVRFRQWRIGAVLYNLTSGNYWADDAGRYAWRPRDIAVWRDFWVGRARPVRWSNVADPAEGFLILYRLDGPVPGRGAAFFLPGTESVFTAPRHRHFDGRPYAESGALLDPYRGAFRGIGTFAARDAMLALGWDRFDRAATSVRVLSAGLTPDERAILASFGVPVCDAPDRLPGWLRRHLPATAIHRSPLNGYFLNLGLPPVMLPAGK